MFQDLEHWNHGVHFWNPGQDFGRALEPWNVSEKNLEFCRATMHNSDRLDDWNANACL